MARMRITNSSVALGLIVLSCCACYFVTGTAAAAQKSGWRAGKLEAVTVGEIQGERGIRIAADNGILIVVRGKVKPFDSSRPGLKTGEIILEGRSAAAGTWKAEPIAIGLVKRDNRCFFQFPDAIIKGTESLGVLSAGEIRLSREAKGAPMVVTLIKSPANICLAFRAPRDMTGKLRLDLASTRNPVALKSGK